MRKIVYIFIVFFLFLTTLQAQIPELTKFTTNNGLPSNTINQTKEYRKKIKDYCDRNQLFITFSFP